MKAAITTEGVVKSYGRVQALKSLDLEVAQGEIFGLIGPDGAGKTTLIRILTSLLLPDEGRTTVLGLDPVRDYRKLRDRLGYMPGRFSLYQDLSVEENLTLFASIFETTIQENYELVADIYRQIEPFKDRKAGALSGGMKQKLALCCAMIHRPEILFLDEPTTGVDPVSRKEFWEMLKKLNNDGLTIFVTTPYMDEANLCHRVGLIQAGQLMAVDTPKAINKLFRRPLFAVKGKNKYSLLQDLKAHSEHVSAYSFGSEIHFTSNNDRAEASRLEEHLRSRGYDDVTVEPIVPGIEDTFMALMSTHDEE